MAHQITVSTAQMKMKAAELKKLNNQFKKEVGSLRQAEGHLNGMWDGQARNAFHKAFTSDMVQMDNFYNAIEQYVNKLTEIATAYEKAEKANTTTATTRSYK